MPGIAGNPIAGTYTTIRDGGIIYSYQGTWSQFEHQILWRAEVKRDGEIKGVASDHLRSVTSVAPESIVRRMIHDSIERLVRLRK